MPRAPSTTAALFIPAHPTLKSLTRAVQKCTGCPLYLYATQAVLGEGRAGASLMLVGEQPGDVEDRQGRPFVGPAGSILDRALAEAEIDRAAVYVTNAVKHFKFEERGKRRIHKKPGSIEIAACKPWLEAEVEVVKPRVIVCLGATATHAILGPKYRLTVERGRFVEHPWAPFVTATVHPSAVLRAPDEERRHAQYQSFVADLKKVRDVLRARAA